MFEIIREVDDIEDIQDLEQLKDIEGIERLENLEEEDLETLENIAPVVRNIYSRIPQNIIDIFQADRTEKDLEEDKAELEEIELSEKDFLPDSIQLHPSLTLKDYQKIDEIPEPFLDEIEKEYINRETVVLRYKADFPEREISELRELDEVEEKITADMIEDNREVLEHIYNFYEITGWYREKLLAEGWEMTGKKRNIEERIFFEHEEKGFFIIAYPENFIYTPKL